MDKKYGVYICTGCGIGEALDVKSLCAVPEDEGLPVKTHPCFCGKEGVELLKKDIADGTNTLVLAACSRRVNFDTFRFDGCIVDRVNIREGVVWSHPRDQFPALTDEEKEDEDNFDRVQMMAEDYIRMGMARVEKVKLPEAYKQDNFSERILVIGGGITGISAAVDAAKAGYEVTVVEKESYLGGYAAKVRKQTPVGEPYDSLIPPIIQGRIDALEKHPNITVKTNTVVARIAGEPGDFTVTFKKPGEKIEFDVPYPLPDEMKVDESGKELDVETIHERYMEYNKGRKDILTLDPNGEKFGAVVLAAGWRPYKPADGEFANLGYGEIPDVVTNARFEELAAAGPVKRPSDGKPAKSVVFIQSPGGEAGDADFSYAGAVTSMVSLKQAKYVREDYEDGKAYVFYQHMRTPGLNENFYKSIQQDPGIFLTKGEVIQVSSNGDGLVIDADNTLLGENIRVKADMVVLGTGMVPATADDPVVNLAYRQGPAFRDIGLFNGYSDSNFICFPYETQRTGIYAAGAVRRSMTMEESIEDAAGAALKAIQCIRSTNRGVSVHPRSGDMTFPDFFFQRCTQCKRCTEECPFGALDDDAKGTPKPNPARCRRCGTCMGACPERIIGFADYNVDSIGSMVKSVKVPSEDDYSEPPFRVLGLVCENDAFPALDMAAINGLSYSADVRLIPVRCLGSVNVIWIKDALSQGMDGVFLLGCKHGDDYQCHFVKGSELAEIRMKKIGDALASLALEEERVAQFEIAIDQYDKVPEIINGFVESIEALGPNPFKGF
ncbi:FAD-dependent oxidoreductase [Desulfococcus multivorans]|uniref:Methyl-viologen-reducing hydrogenase delta subunit n=1 Tax=Desulfococcus multivorans DSM 2059 TaxID=1121405 RepID=S7TGK7_DESML|nr:FAD-dependent oxidoreductase [Desulfococcus multivorans]AOY59913.1 QmoB: quinone interacting membrane bound oxidoreductase, subunit B [Desulfococcus multivorans]AQV02066.1 heterodisulfide reductase subunit A [Desulfococcus multivorans]EPR35911.1 methyl-viologen-reducing hydrogenase delta subunit [Desulfococcus multivorans DSM 2059]SJZ35032.1 putative adenylylsulfate reductase-associated electron transfer protein QmoB [Desulfococcus multivorans DSM 2059]